MVASADSANKTWFSFAIGYGYGKKARIALYRTDPSWDPPRYLKGLPIIDNRDELVAFYRIEEAEWSILQKRSVSRAAILEMGISFHGAVAVVVVDVTARRVDRNEIVVHA